MSFHHPGLLHLDELRDAFGISTQRCPTLRPAITISYFISQVRANKEEIYDHTESESL